MGGSEAQMSKNMIKNVNVYGLQESLVASGYPMSVDIDDISPYITETMYDRGIKLGNAKQGSGHDCYLKGVIVQMDVKFPQYIWQQVKRYNWFDFVSSQSTMHRITKMNVRNNCNMYVDPRIIDILQEHIDDYNEESDPAMKQILFQYVISNIPSGFLLTARITTNYLQLKTIYQQRRHHKMEEWKEFCEWIESLPMFKEICLKRVA